MYVYSTEHHVVRLLNRTLRPDEYDYKYLEIGINVGPPSCEDRPERSSRTWIVAVSRNVEGSLWTAMKYLQNASKRIQRQFHNGWIANGQSLNDAMLDATYRFFVRTHDDDRNDATPYVWSFKLLPDSSIDVKYTRFSNIASENVIRDNIFNGHQLVDGEY